MDQYSREFIAEKARLRPEDLGLVRTARRSHNQLGLAYQIAFIRLTGRAPGQQPFEILEDLVGYVATELNANPRDLDLYARRASQRSRPIWRGSASTLASQPSASRRFARGSGAGSSRENSYTPSPGASTTADWADWISATSNAKPARRAACFSSSQLSSVGRFGKIDRVLSEAGSDADDLNFELLSHISPIGWDNVLLYGEYQLNRSLVRSERLSV